MSPACANAATRRARSGVSSDKFSRVAGIVKVGEQCPRPVGEEPVEFVVELREERASRGAPCQFLGWPVPTMWADRRRIEFVPGEIEAALECGEAILELRQVPHRHEVDGRERSEPDEPLVALQGGLLPVIVHAEPRPGVEIEIYTGEGILQIAQLAQQLTAKRCAAASRRIGDLRKRHVS